MLSFSLASLALLASVQLTTAATFNVTVGGPGILKFDPESVTANPGDLIFFNFKQKNHTVTQSTFGTPCAPLSGGFDSGFNPVADTATVFPVAMMQVKDTTPVWAYCRQGTHCSTGGMVFAVNPGDKFAAFKAAATSVGGSSSAAPPAASPSTASPPPATTPPTTTPSVTTSTDHRIVVGGTGVLAFNPANITAKAGDTITFEFHQKNHTVTQSSFDSPCLNLFSTSGTAGFDSGYFPVADGTTTFPTYVVQVNDTKPIWAYCKQANHCAQGMVFSANADESSSKSFSSFQTNAKQSNGTTSSTGGTGTPYGTSAGIIWRPSISSTSMAVLFVVSIAALAL